MDDQGAPESHERERFSKRSHRPYLATPGAYSSLNERINDILLVHTIRTKYQYIDSILAGQLAL